MTDAESYFFKKIFDGASWYESKGLIHIGFTTGKPGHWVVHPLCGRRLRNWLGFSDLSSSRAHSFCDDCLLFFMIERLHKKRALRVEAKEASK